MRTFIPLSQGRYLGKLPFKWSFPLKDTFEITCTNYPVPAKLEIFHEGVLAFANNKFFPARMMFL